ncbi:hypothetical protein [Reyranella sp.]
MPVATFFLATIAFAASPAEAQDRVPATVTASIDFVADVDRPEPA